LTHCARPRGDHLDRVWAFLHQTQTGLRLEAVAKGDADATTARVSDAFGEASAFIVGVHFFGGVVTVLSFEVAPENVVALRRALSRAGLEWDARSTALLDGAARGHGVVEGTLAITFSHGDADRRHEVPAVPG
jgi:hypothetical protein